MKLRPEISKLETERTIQRINKTKSWFFDKINKIDKPLDKPTKKETENIHINKIRNGKGDIRANIEEIQIIIRFYFKNLYSTKIAKSEQNGQFS